MPMGVYPHTHIKPKVYDAALVAEVARLYQAGASQVEVGEALGLSQRVIWRIMHNHGIPTRPQIKRDQRGAKNSSWRGADATYAALHKRVEVARGTPSLCNRCGTTKGAGFDWANLTGKFDDVNDYERLCKKCHHEFDSHRRSTTGKLTSAHIPRRRKR